MSVSKNKLVKRIINPLVIMILFLLLITSAAQAYVICGPEKVTRGGIAIYTPVPNLTNPDLSVDGQFNIHIKQERYPYIPETLCNDYPNCSIYDCRNDCDPRAPIFDICNCTCYSGPELMAGFISNPQTMTGAYGDRPPFFTDGQSGMKEFNTTLYGSEMVYPVVDREASFFELVPNGETYPSKGEWYVPFSDKNHYYGLTNITDTLNYPISINTLYPYQYGQQSLKPGNYTIHFQRKDNPTRNTSLDYSFEVVMGDVEVAFKDYNNGMPITSIKRGQKIRISGENTDGPDTYLWLKGYGLPECGTNLLPSSLPIYSTSPTKINASIINSDESPFKGEYHSDGTWEIVWDTTPLPLLSGQSYSIYASSINPEEVLPLIPPRGSCTTTEKGLCAFASCPNCEPLSDPATITLLDPSPIDVTINPVMVSPCCCQGYPCGTSDSADKITLKMKTGVSRLPIQIWMFGDSSIGERGYLFNDDYKTLLDDDGTFELDINQYLLEPYGLKLCDLEEGNYTVVVQVPYVTASGDEVFDVTLETSKYATKIPNAMYPRDQDSTHLYVVKSDPLYWTKAFPVEGPGSYSGNIALSKLKSVLSESTVRDKAAYATFSLSPNYCPDKKSVNFEANIQEGYAPLSVNFTDKSSFIGSSFSWDFGDNSTSSKQNPEHVYENAGTYSVNLIVTDSAGNNYNRLKPSFIVVKDIEPQYFNPNADFTYTNSGNEPQVIQFIDQSYGATPLSYSWEFGDNSSSIEKSPRHSFPSVGPYVVNLSVMDQFGKSAVTSKTIEFKYFNPDADFTYTNSGNELLVIQFIDQSYGATPLSYSWGFGDNSSSIEKSPRHSFPSVGTYVVNLSVMDQFGKSAATSKTINVPPVSPAVANFDVSITSGNPRQVQFIDKSTGEISSWKWTFGDGLGSSIQSPDHLYSKAGTYKVTLTVGNNVGSNTAYSEVKVL